MSRGRFVSPGQHVLTATLLAVLLAGCSGVGGEQVASAPVGPATAPPVAMDPAGTVRTVGPGADGVAVAAGRLAVAVREPDRLLILDSATGAVARTVPLPGGARDVVADPAGRTGLRFLVTAGSELVSVPLDGAAETRAVLPGEAGDIAVLPDGSIAVGLLGRATVTVIVPDGAVREIGIEGAVDTAGLAAVGDLLGVVDPTNTSLTVVDPATGATLRAIRAGIGALDVVTDRRGRLVVIDPRGGELLAFDVDPLFLRQRYPVPGAPYGTAYDAERDLLWVTLTERNEVVAYDLSGGAPREVHRIPTVRQPDAVAVDPSTGQVYVTGRFAGEVQTFTP